jgi:hypothetical protein
METSTQQPARVPIPHKPMRGAINPFLSDIRHHGRSRLFLNRGQQSHDFVAIDLSKRPEDILGSCRIPGWSLMEKGWL